MLSVIGPEEGVKTPDRPFQALRVARVGGHEVLWGVAAPVDRGETPDGSEDFLRSLAADGVVHRAPREGGGEEVVVVRALAPEPPPRTVLHVALFLATLVTTLGAGALLAGVDPMATRIHGVWGWGIPLPTGLRPGLLWAGAPFALPFLGILLAHELAHHRAARHHGVRATWPYFIPMLPTLSLVGTLGAFIRLRSPIVRRSHLLDIGLSGPAASFLLSVPVLALGLRWSQPLPGAADSWTPYAIQFLGETLWVGDSLLVGALARVVASEAAGSLPLLLHPVAFAGWLGLFVTALNLLPVGQLDGGHILHALSPPLQRRAARVAILALVPLGFLWWGWWLWGAAVLLVSRRRIDHPPVLQESVPPGPWRRRLARASIVLLLLVLTPVPLRL